MRCATERGDFAAWAGKERDPRRGGMLEVINASELVIRILDYLETEGPSAQVSVVIDEVQKALDYEFVRGVEEARAAISAALRYRPISPDETR